MRWRGLLEEAGLMLMGCRLGHEFSLADYYRAVVVDLAQIDVYSFVRNSSPSHRPPLSPS